MGVVKSDRIARYIEVIENPATLPMIAERLSDGEALVEVCRSLDVPYGRVMSWLIADEKRYEIYLRAKRVAAHALVEDAIRIADEQKEAVRPEGGVYDPDVQRDKLRVDTRLKVARQHERDLYGDTRKVTHEITGDFGERLRRAREREINPNPPPALNPPVETVLAGVVTVIRESAVVVDPERDML